MTLSIWRFSHLCLALVASVFLLIASVTGAMLAFEPIQNETSSFNSGDLSSIQVSEFIVALQKEYLEVIDIKIDDNEFVLVAVITFEGDFSEFYINPKSMRKIGPPQNKSDFFEFNRTLHRSLFMGKTGRIIIGISSFLLILISISGIVLILQQLKFKRFFSRIEISSFAQRWHIKTGRLSLVVIFIIATTGSIMMLNRFDFTPKKAQAKHTIKPESLVEEPLRTVGEFPALKNIMLDEVECILFPFSPDKEEYFEVTLHNRDILVNQFTGEFISEFSFGNWDSISRLSYNLHTGKGSILWSIVLFIACLNILFFIYSGFRISLDRRKGIVKNKVKSEHAETVILFGSENGTSKYVAAQLYKAFVNNNKAIYIDDLDNYIEYKSLKRLIIITSTYGEGEAPSNAKKFISKWKETQPKYDFEFAVVGFGSRYYPDFCQFAKDIQTEIASCSKAKVLLPLETIHDQSYSQFNNWFDRLQEDTKVKSTLILAPKKVKTNSTQVIETTINRQGTFLLRLKPNRFSKFQSGDLLAVTPNKNSSERFYSIAKLNGEILLSIRKHELGTCSNYLSNQIKGNTIQTRVIRNTKFHLPKKRNVICIANGSGIAPFLGMAQEKDSSQSLDLFFGIKSKESLQLYNPYLSGLTNSNAINKVRYAFSQDPIEKKQYVQDVLAEEHKYLCKALENDFVVLICGSIAMQKNVLRMIERLLNDSTTSLEKCQQNGQILFDCY